MREFQATVRSNADRLLQARSVVEAVVQTIGHSLASAGGHAPRYAAGPQAAADIVGAGDPRGLRPPLLGARPCR